jgi:hypothetical protein
MVDNKNINDEDVIWIKYLSPPIMMEMIAILIINAWLCCANYLH